MMAEFSLTDRQAEAILNMRLRSLRKLEEMELRTERDKLEKERAGLQQLVESPVRQRNRLKKDLAALRARYGPDTVPYGYGPHCSPRTFGHGGSQCSIGFCDPEHCLVVAWVCNGRCGEGRHQRRNRAINTAIYEDLGLAT